VTAAAAMITPWIAAETTETVAVTWNIAASMSTTVGAIDTDLIDTAQAVEIAERTTVKIIEAI
jgi:hypothetical protein